MTNSITNNFNLQPQQILSDDTIDKFSHQNPLNCCRNKYFKAKNIKIQKVIGDKSSKE